MQTKRDTTINGDRPMEHNTTHHINESADKIQAETKVKRGTDTRDQDTIKVKVKGDDPDDVVADLNRTVALIKNTAKAAREIGNE